MCHCEKQLLRYLNFLSVFIVFAVKLVRSLWWFDPYFPLMTDRVLFTAQLFRKVVKVLEFGVFRVYFVSFLHRLSLRLGLCPSIIIIIFSMNLPNGKFNLHCCWPCHTYILSDCKVISLFLYPNVYNLIKFSHFRVFTIHYLRGSLKAIIIFWSKCLNYYFTSQHQTYRAIKWNCMHPLELDLCHYEECWSRATLVIYISIKVNSVHGDGR